MTTMIDRIANWDAAWSTRFPIRLTKKQKDQFRQELESELHKLNFDTERITVRKLFRCINVVTKCENPQVIFMAHYDTPGIIPFWFSWLFRLIGHTRQITAMIVLISLLIGPSLLPISDNFVTLFHLFIIITFLMLLIPNPHNREDNTSGVIGLMAVASWLKEYPDLQKQVQLVFTDNEELGLLGAAGLRKHWQKQGYPYEEAAIINLDCISRGKTPLLIYHKDDRAAQKLLPYLQKHLPAIQQINMNVVALSDNYVFRKEGAVNISYANPTLIPGGFYIPKIHTPADNDFDAKKLYPLIQALTDFLKENGSMVII
ncbi:MAG: Zn-dependent exopeptidase M28 [Chloroflexi bacterium]|nr:Zn-dependent exopeptidase M28 [Chloroflexota bacterium]